MRCAKCGHYKMTHAVLMGENIIMLCDECRRSIGPCCQECGLPSVAEGGLCRTCAKRKEG
jgi:hypothetical protein